MREPANRAARDGVLGWWKFGALTWTFYWQARLLAAPSRLWPLAPKTHQGPGKAVAFAQSQSTWALSFLPSSPGKVIFFFALVIPGWIDTWDEQNITLWKLMSKVYVVGLGRAEALRLTRFWPGCISSRLPNCSRTRTVALCQRWLSFCFVGSGLGRLGSEPPLPFYKWSRGALENDQKTPRCNCPTPPLLRWIHLLTDIL